MKLEKLSEAVRATRTWGLDLTDVLLLARVAEQIKAKEPVTIMQLVDNSDAASPATNHARVKRLCDQGFLKKVECTKNLRHKVLEKGDKFDKYLSHLAEV